MMEPYYYGNGSLKSTTTLYNKCDPRRPGMDSLPHIPKPPPPPGMAHRDGSLSGENEYTYRVRMQQGMMRHHPGAGIPPPYCHSDMELPSPGGSTHPRVEHIYESPVFARRERGRDVDGPQYFEVDPDGEPPSPPPNGHGQNVNPAPLPPPPPPLTENYNYRVLHAGSS